MSRIFVKPQSLSQDRAVLTEDLDESFDAMLKVLNGGLDVRNIKGGTKFGISNAGGSAAVSYAWLEPAFTHNFSCTITGTGSLTTSVVGIPVLASSAFPSAFTGTPVYAGIILFNNTSTAPSGTVTFKKRANLAGAYTTLGTGTLAPIPSSYGWFSDASKAGSYCFVRNLTSTLAYTDTLYVEHPAISGVGSATVGVRCVNLEPS